MGFLKRGGSDVTNGTETVAKHQSSEKLYKLYGYKWFSSATDADLTITLAKCIDSEKNKVSWILNVIVKIWNFKA